MTHPERPDVRRAAWRLVKMPTLLLLLVSVLGVVSAWPALAMDNPRVEDDAGFFSPDAVAKATPALVLAKRE